MYISSRLQKYDLYVYVNMKQQAKFRQNPIHTTLHPGVSYTWYILKLIACEYL